MLAAQNSSADSQWTGIPLLGGSQEAKRLLQIVSPGSPNMNNLEKSIGKKKQKGTVACTVIPNSCSATALQEAEADSTLTEILSDLALMFVGACLRLPAVTHGIRALSS
jgi:hypothetical protein